MKKQDEYIFYLFGLIPVIWLGLLIAPICNNGLFGIIRDFNSVIDNPFKITICNNTIKVVLVLILAYVMGIGIYISTKKNYRRNEEHGSAKWGNINKVKKKYEQLPITSNKILTNNISIGYNAHKHRRNLNTIVVGGSGAGKTRFYGKPNLLQGNTSFVVLDPKGELVRAEGNLLKQLGYDIKILDLIHMDYSHCYNPFVYIRDDNDVQKLVTNLFKDKIHFGILQLKCYY